MFQEFVLGVAFISSVLGITVAQSFLLEDQVAVVPTIRTSEIEQPETIPDIAEQQLQEAEEVLTLELQDTLLSAITPPQQKQDISLEPAVDAWAALVMDTSTKQVLWQKNPEGVLPIASITKLMTALTWIDNQPADGLEHVHTFAPEQDTPEGKELNLAHGEQLKAYDLLRSSLVGSNNDTAMALVATTGLGEGDFIAAMNERAQAIGMNNTVFADPTGLSAHNKSTAYDIALLAHTAFVYENIQVPAGMTEHIQATLSGKLHTVKTTNKLLFDQDIEIIAGKTGYIPAAGYCIVVQAQVPDADRTIIGVVLGTSSDAARFSEMKNMIQWTIDSHEWVE